MAHLIASLRAERDWEPPPRPQVDQEAVRRLAELFRPGERLSACDAIPEGGHNCNYRLAFEGRPERLMIRLYASDPEAWRKEPALYRALAAEVPMPEVAWSGFEPRLCPLPATVFVWVEGEPLLDRVAAGRRLPRALFARLGEALAHVHARPYDGVGDLGGRLQIIDGLPPFETWPEAFLNERARQRLGLDEAEHCRAAFKARAAELTEISAWTALVHGDFRPCNLIVRDDRLAAVIDWEFAMAGHPWSDLGQILRHDWMDLDEAAVLAEAYQAVSGARLPASWVRLARLCDCVNLLQLIGRPPERPRQHADLRRLILRALED